MKELLRLHWRLERNHIKRRLSYLRIYFDWAGTITYLYVAAFFIFLIGWYLYDPYGRIPLPVRQSIALGGQLLFLGAPLFWVLGGIIRAAFTPVLMSMADAHYLPLSPVKKAAIIFEQWLWALSRRLALAILGPLLLYPLLRIFWPGYTLNSACVMQGIWLVSGLIGLDIQWLLAGLFGWVRRQKIWAWFKGAAKVLFLIFLLFAGAALGNFPPGTNKAFPPAPLPSHASQVSLPSLTLPGMNVFPVFLLFGALLSLLVLWWYAGRPWAPILEQAEQVHTLRTLMRSRDKRALQRSRRRQNSNRLLSRLLRTVYVRPKWALAWKGVLGWNNLPFFQLVLSLVLAIFMLRFQLQGVFPGTAANPYAALLSPILYQQFPVTLFILQGFVGLLNSWQEDLQQMEKFRLLPLYPRQIIISSIMPAGMLCGVFWAAALVLLMPLRGPETVLRALFALGQGFLGASVVAREMLKDPSSYTSALGPERLLSGAVFLLGPVVMQSVLAAGASRYAALSTGIIVSGGMVFLWLTLMANEYILLRAKYGV